MFTSFWSCKTIIAKMLLLTYFTNQNLGNKDDNGVVFNFSFKKKKKEKKKKQKAIHILQ